MVAILWRAICFSFSKVSSSKAINLRTRFLLPCQRLCQGLKRDGREKQLRAPAGVLRIVTCRRFRATVAIARLKLNNPLAVRFALMWSSNLGDDFRRRAGSEG